KCFRVLFRLEGRTRASGAVPSASSRSISAQEFLERCACMAGTWPKVIRDPVHELIPFEDTPCDRLLWDLINTIEFQRLRRIKQLGVWELVFPGADHSRFSHSIGVMHIARSFVARIRRVWPGLVDEERETLVLAAALVHDVGHGPFSHSFESITG